MLLARPSELSPRSDKDNIVALQWLIAISLSYLIFAVEIWNSTNPIPGLLISTCLISAVTLQRVPDRIFVRGLIEPGLILFDSLLVVAALVFREQTPWDLLLLFFFCVFIAAIGENLVQVAIISVLLSCVFLLFFSKTSTEALTVGPDSLIRVPFMFCVSLFYGYMTSRVKQQKKRIEQVEQAVKARRQFICALAHDIKTPLNVIGGYAELLAGDCGGKEDPTERGVYLKHIRENVERVLKLVTDFLTVSKLETLGLETAKEIVQMNAIAEDVVLQQMVIAREKGVKLILELDSGLKEVLGDNNQIERAVTNLVGNAVKFTPSGGTVSVSSRMNGKDVALLVTDTGPGIPAEEVPKLFSEFERLKGSIHTDGSGLGLFIVKTIVEAHKGSVTVESKEGIGSSFTIRLPAYQNSSAQLERETHHTRQFEIHTT